MMVRWLRWHCPPDTGFEIRALAVWGRARYLSVTEAPHNTNFHTWMGKKHFCFFQTAETGNRTPNFGVKASGANHYPRAPAQVVTKGVTPLSLGEGTVFKPNGEYVFRSNCHFLSASSRPILFRVMSPVFFNTSRYNTLRWVALQLPELKCVATAVSFLSRTSERCMFILFLKESPVSPT